MSLWYPPIAVQYEQTSKLPCQKIQYHIYVKDINLDVHIKVLKKAIRANGENVEDVIINLFGFTLQNNISEWGKEFL
jgi:hypothetical protein